MRDYFKRLKHHPGVPVASVYGALFLLAGCANRAKHGKKK